MHVLSIYDLNRQEALRCAKQMRFSEMHFQAERERQNVHVSPEDGAIIEPKPVEDVETITKALSLTGGRLSFIGRLARAQDLVHRGEDMVAKEKGWLLSQIGLIDDCDDDVMDEVCSFCKFCVLLLTFMFCEAKMELMLMAFVAGVCEAVQRP